MASFLRLVTSNHLVTRSVVPTAVSASRVLSIHRSYSTAPKEDFYDQPLMLRIMDTKISSMSFTMSISRGTKYLHLKIPKDGLSINLDMPGPNLKDMRACAEQKTSFIKEGMKYGQSKVTLSENEESESSYILTSMANDIIASFRDITAERSWLYYDMFFDRSIIGKELCPIIAMLSSINSFSIEKTEIGKYLCIHMYMPGKDEIKLTTQGLRVSLNMSELEREDVKTFFDYDTFFIEGQNANHHYITGIHLPKGFHMKHNMIRKEMNDGVFYAFLPCSGNKEVLHAQLIET